MSTHSRSAEAEFLVEHQWLQSLPPNDSVCLFMLPVGPMNITHSGGTLLDFLQNVSRKERSPEKLESNKKNE